MPESLTSPSLLFTSLFAIALVASLLTKFWLASRQVRHVAQHRNAVPTAFAQAISLEAHQKAADYTVAKARLGMLEMALSTAVLLGWTLLGGLSLVNDALTQALGAGMTQQLALLVAFVVISGVIDLPMSWYQTFVLEERFGFNKTTLKLWVVDMLKGSAIGAVIGLPIAAFILWVMASTGGLWWLWAWLFWMGFNLLLLVIFPTLIAPRH